MLELVAVLGRDPLDLLVAVDLAQPPSALLGRQPQPHLHHFPAVSWVFGLAVSEKEMQMVFTGLSTWLTHNQSFN